MKTEVKKLENSEVEVICEIESEEFEKAKNKALKKLAKNVSVKGFRKGKAPLEIAKDHISPMDLNNEAINEALNEAYPHIITDNKIDPIGHPEIKLLDLQENSFKVSITIPVNPEVKLGAYKGINIPLDSVEVTKEEIDQSIKDLLENNSELVLKEGQAELGDTVIFDFKGYINGKEFEGGSADNYSLVLGSNQFIPGFEEQLVGVTSESKKDVVVTFPEQYIKDLAGKEAKFVCLIHEIKTKNVPELNEEFVKSLDIKDVNTVEELEHYQKTSLENKKLNDAKSKQYDDLINTIIDSSEVIIPDVLIKQNSEQIKNNFLQQIEQNGLTLKQYLDITGQTEESLEEEYRNQATVMLKHDLVINKISQTEHLIVTEGDIDDYYSNIANIYNVGVDDVKKAYKGNEQQIFANIFNNKIHRFLVANNFTEAEIKNVKEEVSEKEEKSE